MVISIPVTFLYKRTSNWEILILITGMNSWIQGFIRILAKPRKNIVLFADHANTVTSAMGIA
jgi:hypothetical protein